MKYINILYKNNSFPVSFATSLEGDAQKLFDKIIVEKQKGTTSLMIKYETGDLFIDPSQIVHCEISNTSINPR